MATVLEFPASRPGLARTAQPGLGAEIVFFPGVRFERRDVPAESTDRAAPENSDAH